MRKNQPLIRMLTVMLAAVVAAVSLSGCSAGSSGSKMPTGAATNEILTLGRKYCVKADSSFVSQDTKCGLITFSKQKSLVMPSS